MSETCGRVINNHLARWGENAIQPLGLCQTYIHDKEVQPAPSIRKVGLEAIGNPLEEHLDDKNVGENSVCKFQNDFNSPSSFDVDVFESLPREKRRAIFIRTTDTVTKHMVSKEEEWQPAVGPAASEHYQLR